MDVDLQMGCEFMSISIMYEGALPLKAFWTKSIILSMIWNEAGNQGVFLKMDVM